MNEDISLDAYLKGIPLPAGMAGRGFCESAAAVYPCVQQLTSLLTTLIGPGKAAMLRLSLKMDSEDIVMTTNCVHELITQYKRLQDDNCTLADNIVRLQSNNRAKDTRMERDNEVYDKSLRDLTFSLQSAKSLENDLRKTIAQLKQDIRALNVANDDLTRRYDQLEHAKRKLERENESLMDRLRSHLGIGGGGTGGLRLPNTDSNELAGLLDLPEGKQGKGALSAKQDKESPNDDSIVAINAFKTAMRRIDTDLRSLHFELLNDRKVYDKAPLSFNKPDAWARSASRLIDNIKQAYQTMSANCQKKDTEKQAVNDADKDESEEIITFLKKVIQDQKGVIEQLTKAAQRALVGVSVQVNELGAITAEKLILEAQRKELEDQTQDAERIKAMMQHVTYDL